MRALAKTSAGPGLELVDVPVPPVVAGSVKVRVIAGSICGTDLHIDRWDDWAAGRIHPPRVVGHEFCGEIVEVGDGVPSGRIGEFIASESHVVAPDSDWMRRGLGHLDPATRILGVDVDGGFAEYAVIPAANARPVSRSVAPGTAALLDAFGNAIHTLTDGPVEGLTILVAGLGPIGLMAAVAARALGARRVIGTEIAPYRVDLALRCGVDRVCDPRSGRDAVIAECPDGTLEMSGHAASLDLAIEATAPGGRISQLGVFGQSPVPVDVNDLVFRGLRLSGITGRRMWRTWDEMAALLAGGLDLSPVVTHEMPVADFRTAYDLMASGMAGKIVLRIAS